jgi:hypothetical protein
MSMAKEGFRGMGGLGSGRRKKRQHRTVETCLMLDADRLSLASLHSLCDSQPRPSGSKTREAFAAARRPRDQPHTRNDSQRGSRTGACRSGHLKIVVVSPSNLTGRGPVGEVPVDQIALTAGFLQSAEALVILSRAAAPLCAPA